MKTEFKGHPLMMLRLLKPFLFVLVLPLLKGLAEYLIFRKADGILLNEAVVCAVIVFISVLRLRAFSLTVNEKSITVKEGLIFKKRSNIELSRISSVAIDKTPIDALFGAVTFKVNTEAGRVGKPDFEFKLSKKNSISVSNLLYGSENRSAVCFKNSRIIAAAALGSSAVTGIIVGVPIVNQMGKLLGVALSEMLFDEINTAANQINTYFPPIFNIITLVLLISYLFSFFYTVLKTLRFRLNAEDDRIEVRHGIIIRKTVIFKRESVNDVCIEQTPLLRLFKRYAMRAAVGGFGGSKKEKALLVPIGSRSEILQNFSCGFSFLKPNGRILMAARNRKTYMRFVRIPLVSAFVTVAVFSCTALFLHHFDRFAVFVMFVALGFIAYYAGLCRYNFRYGKLILGESIYACGSRGFSTREIYLPKEKLGCIRILQNPFDYRKNTCRVRITVCSESADSLRILHLDKDAVKENIAECFNLE